MSGEENAARPKCMMWNPWHGCRKISAGCLNCYMFRQDALYERDGGDIRLNRDFELPAARLKNGEYRVKPGTELDTCFTSDFFLEEADEWRIRAWEMIAERRDLTFLILTKRIDRFYVNLPEDWGAGYPHVAIGCTAENQDRANYRLPIFSKLPILHKIIVCSPLLERIDVSPYLDGVEMVSVGGESGGRARVCDYDWVLDLAAQCRDAGTDFWFQQTGALLRKDGRLYRIPRKYQHSQARKAGLDRKGQR